jgi:type 1 fimbria pilin
MAHDDVACFHDKYNKLVAVVKKSKIDGISLSSGKYVVETGCTIHVNGSDINVEGTDIETVAQKIFGDVAKQSS